jgi:methyl-galactoside transport system permease protein
MGVNANAQYIAIGIVIFVAISLDIRKYVARK